MCDSEKVIKALAYCATDEPCTGEKFMGCEYRRQWGSDWCFRHLVRDALELLKAQEPRVMTLEEVKTSAGCDVWLELSGNIAEDVMIATTIEGCGAKGICTRYESLNYVGYGIKPYGWRCWTSRPTDAQREAVKWE